MSLVEAWAGACLKEDPASMTNDSSRLLLVPAEKRQPFLSQACVVLCACLNVTISLGMCCVPAQAYWQELIVTAHLAIAKDMMGIRLLLQPWLQLVSRQLLLAVRNGRTTWLALQHGIFAANTLIYDGCKVSDSP